MWIFLYSFVQVKDAFYQSETSTKRVKKYKAKKRTHLSALIDARNVSVQYSYQITNSCN